MLPTIVFLDAAGLVWERIGSGNPKRILDLQAYLTERKADREAHWHRLDQAAATTSARPATGQTKPPQPHSPMPLSGLDRHLSPGSSAGIGLASPHKRGDVHHLDAEDRRR
jgi:hypothetical protein